METTKINNTFSGLRSRSIKGKPLKKSTLTLTKAARRLQAGESYTKGKIEGGYPKGVVRRVKLKTRSKPDVNRETTPVQTDNPESSANLSRGFLNESLPKVRAFRKNAIKILNWLFENPEISAPPPNAGEGSDDDVINADTLTSMAGSENIKELFKVIPPEWRIIMNGNQFTVQGNSNQGDSFYRALAQAVTGDEQNSTKLREHICKYVCESQWSNYVEQVRRDLSKRPGANPSTLYATTKYLSKMYRSEQLKQRKPGSYFELRVASDLYKFNFSLVFKRHLEFTIVSFMHKQYNSCNKTLTFLVWTTPQQTYPIWNWLIPVGDFCLPDGNYPIFIKRTYVVQNCCYGKHLSISSNLITDSNQFLSGYCMPNLFTFEVASSVELSLPTSNLKYPQDLFSILSMIFFENMFHAEEIQEEILEHRRRFNYFISIAPTKKRHTEDIHVRRNRWGDSIDLKIAASLYKFCYSCIIMDRLGNLSHVSECRDRTHRHIPKEANGNFIALLTRVSPRNSSWYKLELYNSGGKTSGQLGKVNDSETHDTPGIMTQLDKKQEPPDGMGGMERNVDADSSYTMAEQARLAFEAMYEAVVEAEGKL